MSSLGRWRFGAGAFFLLVFALPLGCKKAAEREPPRPRTLAPTPAPDLPELPETIDAKAIAKGLDYRIGKLRSVVAKQADATSQASYGSQLVSELLEDASIRGRLASFSEAVRLAERLVSDHGEAKPELYITLARALGAVHRFDEASAALDKAVASGNVKEGALSLQRASIALAKGQPRRAWELLKAQSKSMPSTGLLVLTAVALADLGEIEGAESEFRRALTGHQKGSAPGPIARALFHWGRVAERQGKRARAKQLYQLAFDRLPIYAPLVSHFAGLEAEAGDKAKAIELLEALVTQSDDPEHLAQLGELVRESNVSRSTALIEKARLGYDALLAAHWQAFADHAARFYLGAGADPKKALGLATMNLENRKSDEAYQLYLDAAHANADNSEATCAHARAAAAFENASAYVLFAASRSLKACGDEAGAAAALGRADSARRAR